jgi:hypothetical protein
VPAPERTVAATDAQDDADTADDGPDSFFLAREKELEQEEKTILDGE